MTSRRRERTRKESLTPEALKVSSTTKEEDGGERQLR